MAVTSATHEASDLKLRPHKNKNMREAGRGEACIAM